MTFSVMLLCLVFERIFSLEVFLHRKALFDHYFAKVTARIPVAWQKESYGILLIMLPALSVMATLQIASTYYPTKIFSFLVEAVTLLYCLGPRSAYHASKPASLKDIFTYAHDGLFSVLFWFALLGPVGALLFRLVERIASFAEKVEAETAVAESTVAVSAPLLGYLSWLPIRFFIGIQSVLGKFPDTLRYWLDHLLTDWSYNQKLVQESGYIASAVEVNAEQILEMKIPFAITRLVDKMLLVFLGMMLLYTVSSWMI